MKKKKSFSSLTCVPGSGLLAEFAAFCGMIISRSLQTENSSRNLRGSSKTFHLENNYLVNVGLKSGETINVILSVPNLRIILV
jgi:hypothetical protein